MKTMGNKNKTYHYFLKGEITKEAYFEFYRTARPLMLLSDSVVMHISCTGGSVFYGQRLYWRLKNIRKPISVVIESDGMPSAGTLMHLISKT